MIRLARRTKALTAAAGDRTNPFLVETLQTMEMKLKPHSKLLKILALGCGLAVSSIAQAHPGLPGHRHVVVAPAPHVVAPAARVVRPAARANCATYGCSGEVTRTGPHGNTFTRSGNASCADGTCSRNRTITGPNGGTATVNRAISR
jgi:hypothetical protein